MELMHKFFDKHLRIETAKMKYDIETKEEGKKRRVSKEAQWVGKKKSQQHNCSLGLAPKVT